MQPQFLRGAVAILIVVALVVIAGRELSTAYIDEPLFPASRAHVRLLSDYSPSLRGTRGDSELYVFDSGVPGATVLVLGGTHPSEPAGFLAAYVLTENLSVEQGRVIVLPRANHSAFTHTEPGEATPASFVIPTGSGERRFRIGSRTTNPLDQWPDPDVYRHTPSGQELSGAETRNLNRSFPGRYDGNFTERVAAAITAVVAAEHVDLVIDLHEASPEYPVINAIVAHDRALELATLANLNLQAAGLNYAIEPSPQNFHGLTHRELGDATPALAVLMESANIMQGRLRGAGDADKILTGVDHCYARAARVGLVKVPYDSSGISIEERVGRHLSGVRALIDALAFAIPDKPVSVRGIPEFSDLKREGIGRYLSAAPVPVTLSAAAAPG